jgi:hypothetical protein
MSSASCFGVAMCAYIVWSGCSRAPLNDLQVRAVGPHPRGEAVPEHVLMDVLADNGLHDPLDQAINASPADRLPCRVGRWPFCAFTNK